MKRPSASSSSRLEDLPNIGKSMARDFRAIGIETPAELAEQDPLRVFHELAEVMGKRHDPCVLYSLLAVRHFMKTSESLPWWRFTKEGKCLLEENL